MGKKPNIQNPTDKLVNKVCLLYIEFSLQASVEQRIHKEQKINQGEDTKIKSNQEKQESGGERENPKIKRTQIYGKQRENNVDDNDIPCSFGGRRQRAVEATFYLTFV